MKHCHSQDNILHAVSRMREAVQMVRDMSDDAIVPRFDNQLHSAAQGPQSDLPLVGILPALYPEWLGDRGFTQTHGCRFSDVVGEMTYGITTACVTRRSGNTATRVTSVPTRLAASARRACSPLLLGSARSTY